MPVKRIREVHFGHASIPILFEDGDHIEIVGSTNKAVARVSQDNDDDDIVITRQELRNRLVGRNLHEITYTLRNCSGIRPDGIITARVGCKLSLGDHSIYLEKDIEFMLPGLDCAYPVCGDIVHPRFDTTAISLSRPTPDPVTGNIVLIDINLPIQKKSPDNFLTFNQIKIRPIRQGTSISVHSSSVDYEISMDGNVIAVNVICRLKDAAGNEGRIRIIYHSSSQCFVNELG